MRLGFSHQDQTQMTLRFACFAGRALALLRPASLCFVATIALVAQARAEVEVRVEGRPASEPAEAFVKVTDDNGVPVPGLDAEDFQVFVDGDLLTLAPGAVTLPQSQGGPQNVSVVLVMDYSGTVQSTALTALQTAVARDGGRVRVRADATGPRRAARGAPQVPGGSARAGAATHMPWRGGAGGGRRGAAAPPLQALFGGGDTHRERQRAGREWGQ